MADVMLPLAWLAPDIVKPVAKGNQPVTLTAKRPISIALSMDWGEQREVIGFA